MDRPFHIADGGAVDGQLTLGENVADNAGAIDGVAPAQRAMIDRWR